MKKIIFIHGLESSGKAYKAQFLKKIFPSLISPSFLPFSPTIKIKDLLNKRMQQLTKLLEGEKSWIIIGSSFGGLMASIYSFKHPERVRLLILLAPFLSRKLYNFPNVKVKFPVIVYHAKNDEVVPINESKEIIFKLFPNLEYHIVDDEHKLHKTISKINWKALINKY
jgi:pimeloyl-ACP methyl ester carboxylesterase